MNRLDVWKLRLNGFEIPGTNAYTPPTIASTVAKIRSGDMDANYNVEDGMEDMQSSFKIYGHAATMLRVYGIANGQEIRLRANQVYREDNTIMYTPVIEQLNGFISAITPDERTTEGKSENGYSVTIEVNYYKQIVNAVTVIEIDIINKVRSINGTNQLAIKNALLLL